MPAWEKFSTRNRPGQCQQVQVPASCLPANKADLKRLCLCPSGAWSSLGLSCSHAGGGAEDQVLPTESLKGERARAGLVWNPSFLHKAASAKNIRPEPSLRCSIILTLLPTHRLAHLFGQRAHLSLGCHTTHSSDFLSSVLGRTGANLFPHSPQC